MKKLTFSIFVSFAVGLSAISVSAKESMNVFVWKISDKSAKKNNYLVGTMHLPFGEKYSLPSKVLEQIKHSKTFAMEADIKLDFGSIFAMQRYSMLEEKGNLKDLMPEKDWNKLVEVFQPMGFTEDILTNLEPWFLSIMLAVPKGDIESSKDNLDIQKSVEKMDNTLDIVLKNQAVKNNLSIDYFETQEEQMELLDSNPIKDDIDMLVESINSPAVETNMMEESEKSYLRGNVQEFEKEFSDYYLTKYPGYYQNMIVNRNNKWLPKMEKLFNQGNSFIAVGLGHLVGKKGLLEVLRSKGYKVERIKVN